MLWDTNKTVWPCFPYGFDSLQAFFLELGVANRKDLVHQENLRLNMRRYGKRQPHVHSAGVMLDWLVQVMANVGKVDNLVQLAYDLAVAHARVAAFRKIFSRPVSSP